MNKKRKCPVCGRGALQNVNDIMSQVEGYVFVEKGERCSACGEEFIPEEEGQKMISAARKLGVWGSPLKLHRKLTKSAKGIILRIPSDLQKSLALRGDEEVELYKVGKKRVLIDIASGV
ncbi:hypothetical protein HY571_00300 [Candidatus Micrarchaeota archaeon]|nr:hypothetical protein [Candidatus Micrarchaeota archaeon]